MLYIEGEIHYFKYKNNNINERIGVLHLKKDGRAVKSGKKSLILEAIERKVELNQVEKHYA